MTNLHWADLAFGSKKPLRSLNATFIAAPREVSAARLMQLIKQYLPLGNIVIGCADEPYIDGFDGQPQFKTLQVDEVEKLAHKVNRSKSPYKITILHYRQRDIAAIYEKIPFRHVVLINGSWLHSFHTRSEYYQLVSRRIPFTFESPFVDEVEAKEYAAAIQPLDVAHQHGSLLSEKEILLAAFAAAGRSFDTSFQTGAALGKKRRAGNYELIATSYNIVVPYQTFAWHFGPLRERHLSPPGDLNYYDAVHAETALIVEAQKKQIALAGTTLFINLLPCPTCARMLCLTDITEIVYSLDHSDGYAVTLLEKAGKIVRRVVNIADIIE